MKIIHGAMLSILLSGLAWAGNTIVNYSTRISVLESRDVPRKELILRIDRKVDKLDAKIDKILEKVRK